MPGLPATAAPDAGEPSVAVAVPEMTRALRDGDESAWREFHSAYSPRLLRYLIVVCRGREDAAREALQQTFLRVVRHVRCFSTEAELWGWLTVLARSAAADAGRRERRYLGFLDRWFRQEPEPEPQPGEQGGEDPLGAALVREMECLDAAERQLLEHKYLNGGSVRELADALGTTEKAVESRLTRARQKLKAGILARLRHEETI